MARIGIDDLCGSCLNLRTSKGTTVEEELNIRNNDLLADSASGGDLGTFIMLNKTIVMGDGCTLCGAKIIDWGRKLGLG